MPSLEVERSMLSGWTEVAADPMPFLSLGLCSAAWLSRALPTLLRAQASAVLEGDDLVHVDVRSDNLCLLPQRVVFIDWNFARRGNAAFDLGSVAPSIQMEGGPAPEELLPNAGPLACLLAGYFAARAGLPLISDAPRVRWVQQQQLSKALPWAVRELALPALDGVAPGA
jgi:thiamine kinase-like enzyme